MTRWTRAQWLSILVVTWAAVLRKPRILLRWDEVSFQYSAYDTATAEALQAGDWVAVLTGFSGLHPPFYPLLHSCLELLYPALGILLCVSVIASLFTVVISLQFGWLVALVLACSPVQVAYAAELNNYPLTALAVVATWHARERVAGGRPFWELAIVGALAGWIHLLAGGVAVLAAATLPRKVALRALGVMALAIVPLVPNAWDLLTEPGTWRQPPLRPGLMISAWIERFGWLGLCLIPLALGGVRKRPVYAFAWAGTALFVLALQWSGIAAPHQFPYHLALSLPFAVLVAAGASRWGLHRPVVVLVIIQSLWVLGGNLRDVRGLLADQAETRAVDVAMQEAQEGDAIYLLSPPLLEDDDKRAHSAVLSRFSPWRPMPIARPYDFSPLDYRHGQPRQVEGLTLYVNDHPYEEITEAVAAHRALFLVVYDHREDPRFTVDLEERFGLVADRVGSDLLFRLSRE